MTEGHKGISHPTLVMWSSKMKFGCFRKRKRIIVASVEKLKYRPPPVRTEEERRQDEKIDNLLSVIDGIIRASTLANKEVYYDTYNRFWRFIIYVGIQERHMKELDELLKSKLPVSDIQVIVEPLVIYPH